VTTVQPKTGRDALAAAAGVADTFTTLMRASNKARAQMLAAAAHDVEWSASVILRCLSNEGPLRSSALAELIDSDPSTVSRQVAALVKDGLVNRQADPIDGRASLLVLTPKADEVLREHNDIRNNHFARMLTDWDERDLEQFAALLRQFTDDFNRYKSNWLPERVDPRPEPAESTEGKY
jgi:DNA-binding MarR family transcriptional regulator